MKRNFKRKRESLKQRFGYQNGGDVVDPKGYLDSNRDNYSPYKVIPSNQITMEGVSENIIAFPFSNNGNSFGKKLMQPGENFTFPDADYVVEVPESEVEKFQAGGGIGISGIQALRQQSDESKKKLQEMSEANNEIFQNRFNNNSVEMATPMTEPFDRVEKESGEVDIFNPYGGFDVSTAAFTLGQGIEEGNTGKTVGSAGKLALGLGRNFLSGLSGQKRNQYVVDEYNDRQKSDLTRTTTLQDGGQLSEEDLMSINQSSDFQFNLEGANQLFERAQQRQVLPPETYQPNLGKYSDVGYFEVEDTKNDVIKLRTTSRNPHNAESVKHLIPSLQEMNPGKKVEITYVPKAKEGGSLEKILTEGYVTGIENENFKQPNVEVEDGEHIDSEGEPVKEVIGKKHSEGGEKMQLENNDRILSDHLKLGGKYAKHVRDTYDINVKATDTFATVLDKFKKKSGLSKLLEEKEEIIKEQKKQEDVKDESTAGLNSQFLSNKLKEINEKQEPLDVEQKFLFDDMFSLQEESKPKEDTTEEEEVFELGGMKFNSDQIIEMGKNANLSPEDSINFFKEFKKGGLVKAQDGLGNIRATSLSDVPEGQSIDYTVGLAGEVTPESFQQALLRNDWYFSDKPNFDPRDRSQVLAFQKAYNKRAESLGAPLLREDGIWGQQTDSTQLMGTVDLGMPGTYNNINAPLLDREVPVPPVQETVDNGTKGTLVSERDRMDALLLPDQSPMPPDPLQPHLKNQRRFDRIDPNLISPEQQIEEINRNRNQIVQQINDLPDSQRRAALASVNANTNNQLNQVIQQTNRANSQIKTQADMVNLQQSNQEENALASDALSFEERQLRALALTQNDIRNYFNQLNRIQVGNYNTINNLNLLNQAYDDFSITGSGVEKTSDDLELTDAPARRAMLQRAGVIPTGKKGGYVTKKRNPRKKK